MGVLCGRCEEPWTKQSCYLKAVSQSPRAGGNVSVGGQTIQISWLKTHHWLQMEYGDNLPESEVMKATRHSSERIFLLHNQESA